MQQNKLFILHDEEKGRGVFAGRAFVRGDVIEICPVLVLSSKERELIHETSLHDYYFVWGQNMDKAALALGYGSLYNHSSSPNAQFVNELEEGHIIVECLKDIEIGEEIVFNYIDGTAKETLWFNEKK